MSLENWNCFFSMWWSMWLIIEKTKELFFMCVLAVSLIAVLTLYSVECIPSVNQCLYGALQESVIIEKGCVYMYLRRNHGGYWKTGQVGNLSSYGREAMHKAVTQSKGKDKVSHGIGHITMSMVRMWLYLDVHCSGGMCGRQEQWDIIKNLFLCHVISEEESEGFKGRARWWVPCPMCLDVTKTISLNVQTPTLQVGLSPGQVHVYGNLCILKIISNYTPGLPLACGIAGFLHFFPLSPLF